MGLWPVVTIRFWFRAVSKKVLKDRCNLVLIGFIPLSERVVGFSSLVDLRGS